MLSFLSFFLWCVSILYSYVVLLTVITIIAIINKNRKVMNGAIFMYIINKTLLAHKFIYLDKIKRYNRMVIQSRSRREDIDLASPNKVFCVTDL